MDFNLAVSQADHKTTEFNSLVINCNNYLEHTEHIIIIQASIERYRIIRGAKEIIMLFLAGGESS